MKVDVIRPAALGVQSLSVGAVVEAVAVDGDLPDFLRGQRLTATVVEASGQQLLLNVQGTQIAVPAVAGLTPGTELHLRVANVTPKLLVEIVPDSSPARTQLPPLTLGQDVDLEIIEQLPNGRTLVDVQGTVLEAEVASGVPIGTRVQATVEQLHPQLVLHLSANEEQNWQTEAIRLLRSTVAHRVPEGESLQTLLPALSTLINSSAQGEVLTSTVKLYDLLKTLLQDTVPPTAERLATFIRNGGLQYEAKLLQEAEHQSPGFAHIAAGDVKGLLLQALKDLQKTHATHASSSSALSKRPVEEQTMASSAYEVDQQKLVFLLTNHLEHIENQQAVNLLAQAQGEPYQFQIPLFTDHGVTTAFVAIDVDKRGQEETAGEGAQESSSGYNILFLLDLEGLGQTRIEAKIGSKSLWGAFYVDQPASVTLLQTELPAFRETLRALGYDDVLLIAKPLNQLSPEKRQKFDTLAGGVPGSIHLLDVKA